VEETRRIEIMSLEYNVLFDFQQDPPVGRLYCLKCERSFDHGEEPCEHLKEMIEEG
jgi:hypothetical protein